MPPFDLALMQATGGDPSMLRAAFGVQPGERFIYSGPGGQMTFPPVAPPYDPTMDPAFAQYDPQQSSPEAAFYGGLQQMPTLGQQQLAAGGPLPPVAPLPPGGPMSRGQRLTGWSPEGYTSGRVSGLQPSWEYEQQRRNVDTPLVLPGGEGAPLATGPEPMSMQDILSQFSDKPQTFGSGSKTTTTVGPKISQGAAEEYRGKLEEQEEDLRQGEELRRLSSDWRESVLREYAAETRVRLSELGPQEKDAKKTYQTALVSVAEAKKRIDNWKGIDPDRFWARMDNTRRVTAAFSMAIEGFLQGFSGGKINIGVSDMFDRAISRDIAAQRADYSAMLQRYQIATGERAHAAGRLDKLTGRMEGLGRDLVKLELAQGQLRTQDANARIAYAKAQNALAGQDLTVEQLLTPQVTTSKTSSWRSGPSPREQMAMQLGKLQAVQQMKQKEDYFKGRVRELPRMDRDKIIATEAALKTQGRYLDELLAYQKKYSRAQAVGGIAMEKIGLGTEAGDLNARRGTMAMQHIKMLTGAQSNKWEQARVYGRYPRPWDTPKVAVIKYISLLKEARDQQESTLNTYVGSSHAENIRRNLTLIDREIARRQKQIQGM